MAQQPLFDAVRFGAVTMDVLVAGGDSAAGIARRQRQRLSALLTHAQAHSPLFGRLLAGVDPQHATLADLPVTRRETLMPAFDEWVTDPALKLAELRGFLAEPDRVGEPWLGRWHVWESSGTSGLPGVFVQDVQALAVYDALESLRRASPEPWRRWFDPLLTSERLAFVGATGGHFVSLVNMMRLGALQPWRARTLRCLTIQQPTESLVAALNEFGPTIVATYPTAAAMLADEAAAGRLKPTMREVWTGGENLSPAVRRHVESALDCAVRNSYGASEFLPLGWECRCGRLHVNADWAILEPVDEHGRPVPPGTRSATVLLTNLANRVQPLVRYDLGDRVTVSAEPCRCGSALPAIEVEGRSDDRLVMAGAGHSVSLLPLALSTVLEDEAGLFDFELAQRDAHTLVLRLPLAADHAAEPLARGCRVLREFARRQGVVEPKVIGEACAAVARGRSGKARRVSAAPT